MSQPVFISYARQTDRANARALRDSLGADVCFLDERDIELGDKFPTALTDALLAARVVVAFVDLTYFQRWYCLREWLLARAPFDAVVKRSGSPADADAAVSHIVIALSDDDAGSIQRLPPPLQHGSWPNARATDAIATLVGKTLRNNAQTLRVRCDVERVPRQRLDTMVDEVAMPQPLSLAGLPVHPSLPPSLRDGFVGRVNDLWRLHAALTEQRMGANQIAAVTGAIQGGGGFGKTRLALEYVHRFGPTDYRGGLFWIDATEAAPLERQFHGVLRVLRKSATPPTIEEMREAGRDVRAELDQALHEDAATSSILFVVDNVPEPPATSEPQPLDRWCPALARVTCLATSRKRLDFDASIEAIDVDVLSPASAVALLTDDVAIANTLSVGEWNEIVEWVGRLPLALVLLNASLRKNPAMTPRRLHEQTRGATTTSALDAQRSALRRSVPTGALRGITDAFALSFDLLDDTARSLARTIAFLAPAPIPTELMTALASDAQREAALVQLTDRSFLVLAQAGGTSLGGERVMHRVLADYVRARNDSSLDDALGAAAAVESGLAGIDLDQPAQRATGVVMSPHALAAVAHVVDRAASRNDVDSGSDPAGTLVLSVADLLRTVGERSEERALLDASVESYRAVLQLVRRDRAADWAVAQHNLGAALQTLGAREDGTARLEEAVVAYRAALEVRTREQLPLDWAMTQNNLGNALHTLGTREGGTGRIEEAVAAYRAALEVRTREQFPLYWAMTQNNLGGALTTLGEREDGTGRLEEAVAAYRAALEVRTRDQVPLYWAKTQHNLGTTLHSLGAREDGTERLEEAVAAFRAALEVSTRERAPLAWSTTQNNLGNALRTLGVREHRAGWFEEAVAAYRAALEVSTRERVPLAWATTQNNLGTALATLGELEGRTGPLEEAVAAYRGALEVRTRERDSLEWAILQNNLGNALRALGARDNGTARLEEAAAAYRLALDVFEPANVERHARIARNNLRRVEEMLAR